MPIVSLTIVFLRFIGWLLLLLLALSVSGFTDLVIKDLF